MITNPLLEEIWAIRKKLDDEAGGDLHVMCENLRAWTAKNLPQGIVLVSAEELRARHAARERQELAELREEAPGYGTPPAEQHPEA